MHSSCLNRNTRRFGKSKTKNMTDNCRKMRRSQCEEKQQFASQTEAVAAIIAIRKRGGIDEADGALSSYQCEICGKWHIGKQAPNKKTRKRRYEK